MDKDNVDQEQAGACSSSGMSATDELLFRVRDACDNLKQELEKAIGTLSKDETEKADLLELMKIFEGCESLESGLFKAMARTDFMTVILQVTTQDYQQAEAECDKGYDEAMSASAQSYAAFGVLYVNLYRMKIEKFSPEEAQDEEKRKLFEELFNSVKSVVIEGTAKFHYQSVAEIQALLNHLDYTDTNFVLQEVEQMKNLWVGSSEQKLKSWAARRRGHIYYMNKYIHLKNMLKDT